MTPELKRACELVFQEHKTSAIPVNWSKDAFKGRLPFGLSAMAKEILVKKKIIYSPNPSRKILTSLNPAAIGASTLEEAEHLIQNEIILTAVSTTNNVQQEREPVTLELQTNNRVFLRIAAEPYHQANNTVYKSKWYTAPFFYYFMWPLCAAAAGAVIAWAIGYIYTSLFS